MDKTYQKFLRAGIDLSSVGVERRTYNEPYDNFQFVEQITRAHFYTPFGVVHYARNLALPLGELSAQPTEREKHDHTKGQQSAGKRPAVTQ